MTDRTTDRITTGSVWSRAGEALRERLGESAWNAWFAAVEPIDLDDDFLSLSVPADIFKRNIEDRYGMVLGAALYEATGRPMRYELIVTGPRRGPAADTQTPTASDVSTDESAYDVEVDVAHDPVPPTFTISPPTPAPRPPGPVIATQPAYGSMTPPPTPTSAPAPPPGVQIVPTSTFENFITGDSNRFAYAAAQAVAETPGSGYNPLFIYGGTGLGKTHLLHAIVNYARDVAHLRATYVTSEQFTNEFIEMIRADRRTEFRERYRSTDILLIDDIQFLAGKVETQNEFFHTFNHLHQSNRQIVIASDRPPKEISALEDRLRSRFEWGLLTDIQPPDLETRIAILRNKAERSILWVPDDVIEFIATRISDNIRELEGALNRVAAYAKLENTAISLDVAENILAGIGDAGTRQVTSDLIVRETAAYYNLTVEELLGPSRRRPLVNARQVAMYLHRELTELSLPRIGEIFGGRDHTTVLHATRKIEQLMHERRQLLQQVNELANRIKLG